MPPGSTRDGVVAKQTPPPDDLALAKRPPPPRAKSCRSRRLGLGKLRFPFPVLILRNFARPFLTKKITKDSRIMGRVS